MLDSLYEKALKKKNKINERLKEIENIDVDISEFWNDFPIEESSDNITIAGGDGSLKKNKLLSSIFYAIDAETLIFNEKGLRKVESSEIDIMHYHKHAEDRIRSYMGIFEIKNALKSFDEYEVDLYLFDGSLLGNLIRPFPLEKELNNVAKEKIRENYALHLEKELTSLEVKISSSKFSNDLKNENEMIYLENLENIIVVSDFLKKKKIAAISKTSTSNDYFPESKFPDIAIFDRKTQKQGYSNPKPVKVSDYKRDYFPVRNEHLQNLTFTIFYARLEDNKNLLKIELPYEANKEDVIPILKHIKKISAEGYPILLKKAHNDVVIKKGDLERLSLMIGFSEKQARPKL
ncbi:DNA double-strand break repair nuclease NurA [Methanobacterium formicicum]|uniref:DNA double-strand break repair nuclease NurA n=2 Tax=Methanobacterium TaxID=2160 RepID=UPI0024125F91|nr:DNA double-strand break repair nuclease NurA [Methanobacterium formicicum]MDG3546686.1 DNA double-strand break repair nuclease NurA [Methanobacterium formicicum]